MIIPGARTQKGPAGVRLRGPFVTYRGSAPPVVLLEAHGLAGISFPMITFSLSPSRLSLLPWIAASVSTLVVSWKEAADSHDSVASEALVMPMRTGRAEAGSPPSATTRRVSGFHQ